MSLGMNGCACAKTVALLKHLLIVSIKPRACGVFCTLTSARNAGQDTTETPMRALRCAPRIVLQNHAMAPLYALICKRTLRAQLIDGFAAFNSS